MMQRRYETILYNDTFFDGSTQANLQAQLATLKSKMMSLEQQVEAGGASFEAEKARCRTLSEEVTSKSQALLSAQQELGALKDELLEATEKAQESSNHVKILATSCNESKMIIAAKEKVV